MLCKHGTTNVNDTHITQLPPSRLKFDTKFRKVKLINWSNIIRFVLWFRPSCISWILLSGIGRSQFEKNWKEKIENFSPMGKCLGRRENWLYCLWNLQVSNCWNRMLRNESIGDSSTGHIILHEDHQPVCPAYSSDQVQMTSGEQFFFLLNVLFLVQPSRLRKY